MYDVMDSGDRHIVADLTGHTGPVWQEHGGGGMMILNINGRFLLQNASQVAWAHPKYGSLLASCGYDRQATGIF